MRNKISIGPDVAAESLGECPLCGRPMVAGPSIDRHHWVPRSAGGGAWTWMHVVCHRMLHRLFTDAELAGPYADAEALRGHPDIRRFVAWVRRKPPTYVDWPRTPGGGRPDRRR